MISFDSFKIEDGIPIYTQILKHIKQGIVSGTIKNNDELPSRRVLSSLLGVNPNTIQKAYKILEDENLIESHLGSKSFVKFNDSKLLRLREELLESEIIGTISSLKNMGINKNEYIEIIEKYWNEV